MLKQIGCPEVLLVEDDAVTAEVHRYYLRKLGLSVDSVSTGEAAIKSIEETDYAAMILDLGLPDINGGKVLATIRKREKKTKKHLPVIIVTAHGDPRILSHFKRDKKADDGFIKPIRLLDLKQALQRLYYKKVW